ncbi:hypothetical protein BO78DRAFT_417744 [Aspergillus sclerotiicarbonarius CBS 121057]|uniref:Uncharacterized protein n=1 Tax=Aspergillus sclerotiicarbonarius (strain CBS 121057 / IBT 28362) TaxID=1448318 RepID=A0A319EB48_ASPSB|nr:hypothetical protein BO78DRAFT_417744 [Aspergillus sclerotiicarbonarius CBS 121057]
MAGYAWTEPEIALVVYFASIGLQHEVIAELLRQRQFSRTVIAVQGKIKEICAKSGIGKKPRHWNKIQVNNFIETLAIPEIDRLLLPSCEDQEIVSRDIDLEMEYIERRQPATELAMPLLPYIGRNENEMVLGFPGSHLLVIL